MIQYPHMDFVDDAIGPYLPVARWPHLQCVPCRADQFCAPAGERLEQELAVTRAQVVIAHVRGDKIIAVRVLLHDHGLRKHAEAEFVRFIPDGDRLNEWPGGE